MGQRVVNEIHVKLDVPDKVLDFRRSFQAELDKALLKAGTQAKRKVQEVLANYTVNTTYALSKSIERDKRVSRYFTERYIDVKPVGDREKVAAFLEYGTRGGGVNYRALRQWFDKKGIGRGMSEKSRNSIFWAIASAIKKYGIPTERGKPRQPDRYFNIARNESEPAIAAIFNEAIAKFAAKFNADS